jgi:hypothetical protein
MTKGLQMISGLGASSITGANVLQQTSSLMRGVQNDTIATLSSLGSPLQAFSPLTVQSSGVHLIDNLASEKASADTAVALLGTVHDRLQKAQASGNIDDWTQLRDDLSQTDSELEDLRNQAQSSSSSSRIYADVTSSIDSAIHHLNTAIQRGGERGTNNLDQASRGVLSSISKVSQLSDQLERAAVNRYQISSAYGNAVASPMPSAYLGGSNLETNSSSGRILDWVS